MPPMTQRRSAVRLDVALERIQVQERVEAVDDSTRVHRAEERLGAALAAGGRGSGLADQRP